MIISIIYCLFYVILAAVFPRKGKIAMPMWVRVSFMLGFPTLPLLAFVQTKLLAVKYAALISAIDYKTADDVLAQISVGTDLLLPAVIGLIGAVVVLVGIVKVLKAPLSEDPSQFSLGLSGSLGAEYQKDCAHSIAFWGIIIDAVSILFGIGFIVYLGGIITAGIAQAETFIVVGGVAVWMLVIGILIPFMFIIAIPFAIYIAAGTALLFVLAYLSQFAGLVLCGFGCGINFTAAAVIAICAAVRMKKSGSFSTGKTVLYVLLSLIPIVNIFVLGDIRRKSA